MFAQGDNGIFYLAEKSAFCGGERLDDKASYYKKVEILRNGLYQSLWVSLS